mgnify:CR=1 FL=1
MLDEDDYTKALSFSRLAYDLENLLSPMLAAALLSVISFHWLFAGTGIGFIASALFVLSVTLPATTAITRTGGIFAKTTRGLRIYLRTPRLKGLLALSLASAAASAMVIVNTIVIVRDQLGLGVAARGRIRAGIRQPPALHVNLHHHCYEPLQAGRRAVDRRRGPSIIGNY